jgi:hypothetical protein
MSATTSRYFHKRQIVWGLAAGLFGMLSTLVTTSYFNLQPQQIITSVREDDGISYVGGKLKLIITRVPGKICPTRTDRSIWRNVPDPDNPGQMMPDIKKLENGGIVVPLGYKRYMVTIDLPADIETGQWFYASRTVYECSVFSDIAAYWNGRSNPTQSPDTPVMIVPQPYQR